MRYCYLFLLAFVLLPGIAFSQTGPGGVGSSSDNILWLRADEGISASGGNPVSTWNDQSGNSHDFTGNAGSSSKPTFNQNAINGYPAIDFAGDGDEMEDTDGNNYINGLDEFTVFFVINSDQTGVDKGLLDSESPNNTDDVFTFRYDETGFYGNQTNVIKAGILDNNFGGSKSFNNIESSAKAQTTDTQLLTFHWDGTTNGSNELELFINGGKNTLSHSGSNSLTGTISNASQVLIGKGSKDGSSSSWDGLIGEVIIYDRQLDAVEREIVDNYLGEKYGKSVTNDHYSSTAGFDRNVIGIGQKSSLSHTKSKVDGLTIENNSGLANGDFLLAGHDVKNNSVNQSPNNCSGCNATLEARWERVWYMDETDPGNDLKVDLTFDLVEGGFDGNGKDAGPASNYELLHRSSTTGSWTSAGQASNTNGFKVTFTNVDVIDGEYYTIGTTDETNSPLPVELIAFNLSEKDGGVLLTWETASETQNKHFLVQRRTNERWQNLGKVEGHGTTTEPQSYRFLDPNPVNGTNYYRLKQVDFDGSFEYSNVKAIEMAGRTQVSMELLQNPVRENIRFSIYTPRQDNYSYRLLTLDGRTIQQGNWHLSQGRHDRTIPLQGQPAGFYLLDMRSQAGEQWTRKIRK